MSILIKKSLSSKQLMEQVKGFIGEQTFPLTLELENLMPTQLVDHSAGKIVLDSNIKPNGKFKGEYTFKTKEALISFCDNVLTIAQLMRIEKAVKIAFPTDESTEALDTEIEVAETDVDEAMETDVAEVEEAEKKNKVKKKQRG